MNQTIIYPKSSSAPLAHPDIPFQIKRVYDEARNICADSPRASAALMRLCVQMLMPHLGEKGKKIDDDIAELVKKGLSVKIQQALDILRVIGNNAVHPGQIADTDNLQIALKLFGLLNMIVDSTITQEKQIKELYSGLPENAREAIDKRDGK